MKNLIVKLAVLVFLSLTLSGCKKDDYSGHLKITFENHPGDLFVDIYALENTQIPIFTDLRPDSHGVLIKALNPGNYYCVPVASSIYPGIYGPLAFQIQMGSNTDINYDNTNVPHLKLY